MVVRRGEKHYYTLNVVCGMSGEGKEGIALDIFFISSITGFSKTTRNRIINITCVFGFLFNNNYFFFF